MDICKSDVGIGNQVLLTAGGAMVEIEKSVGLAFTPHLTSVRICCTGLFLIAEASVWGLSGFLSCSQRSAVIASSSEQHHPNSAEQRMTLLKLSIDPYPCRGSNQEQSRGRYVCATDDPEGQVLQCRRIPCRSGDCPAHLTG
jgi:hypothetical protein